MATPKDFQRITAERINELLTIKGRNRVLLADEVGLGKTIVAHHVIELFRKWRKKKNDNFYKVVYICSNANISKQNIAELGVQNSADFSDSRLSMQHLQIAKKENEIIHKLEGTGEMPERLVPLTPYTSFQVLNSTGTSHERALMAVVLPRITDIKDETKLDNFLRLGVKVEGWERNKQRYQREIDNLRETNYIEQLKEAFDKITQGSDITSRINIACSNQSDRWVISDLRQIFAQISMDQLDPDLVIMDEFQRFSDLLHPGDDEQSQLVKKFFSNPNTKILLLSATPYKPFSTLEEINEGEVDAYRDFLKVFDFLFTSSESGKFKIVWKNYSDSLRKVSNAGMVDTLSAKQEAEDWLYGVMCRTERLHNNMKPGAKSVFEVDLQEGDIFSYAEGQHLIDTIAAHTQKIQFNKIPLEYVMSSPYLLSFMEHYQLKKYVMAHSKFVQQEVQKSNSILCLNESKINTYESIPTCNGKLKFVHDLIFGELNSKGDRPQNHIHQLLWVPASRPYYVTNSIFEDEASKKFSKCLIFSSWEMVPRMIAVMLSYYAERYTLGIYRKQRGGFTYKTSQKSKTPRVTEKKVDTFFLEYPCHWLANIYNPLSTIDYSIADIRKELANLIKEGLCSNGIMSCTGTTRNSAEQVLDIMRKLDGEDIEVPTTIHPNTLDILVDCTIASPAICTYRIEHDDISAKRVGDSMMALFNKPESAAIIDMLYPQSDIRYYQKVIKYCVDGNLQAVLDEYKFTIKNNKLGETLAIADSNTLFIDTREGMLNATNQKYGIRTHFAAPYIDKVKTDESIQKTKNMQDIFNSPFRPFVLATTSVGQEGLNFHWYARKLVHWNIPSNPVDMEQREGRINRFGCLAIRQSIANLFASKENLASCTEDKLWQQLFEIARDQIGKGYSEMVPYWCIPPESVDQANQDKLVFVERIVPMYPYSSEHAKYEHLMKVLSLYRLTLGQPRQEALLKQIAGAEINNEELHNLLFNLSPILKEKLNK